MPLTEREKMHHHLITALDEAKRRVERIEAALRRNAAYLGTGIESERNLPVSDDVPMGDSLLRYLQLIEPEDDISNYLGSEGVEATRPRLGADAPEDIRPDRAPPVHALVGQLALDHPDDALAFPGSPSVISSVTGEESAPALSVDSLPDTGLDSICAEGQRTQLATQDILECSSARRLSDPGLGLSLIRRLVHLMDGSISVEILPGEGTIVHCSLPFELPDSLDVPHKSAGPVPQEAYPLTVLAAEDDAVNQFALRRLLSKAGHRVVCVNDGKEAIEALLIQNFDCLITDIQMPVMDGLELVRRIRHEHTADIELSDRIRELMGRSHEADIDRLPISPDIPIIALTAHAMNGDRERFLSLGMDYYLSKPIIASVLYETLAHIAMVIHARKEK